MAETSTARLDLPRWSADTDTPSRVEFDRAFQRLEERAAGYLEGTTANRPAASALMARFFYYDRERKELTTCVDTTGAGGWAWVRPDVGLVDEAFAVTPPDVLSPYGAVVDGAGVNYVPNPWFRNNLDGWEAFGGATFIRVSDANPPVGNIAARITNVASTESGINMTAATRPAASAGQVWTASAWWRGAGGSNWHRIYVEFYDAGGANIGATWKSLDNMAAGDWHRLAVTATAPANTASVRATLTCWYSGTTNVWVNGVQLEQASKATSYLDGDLGPGYWWDGTAHASVSRRSGGFHVADASNRMEVPELTVRDLPVDAYAYGEMRTHGSSQSIANATWQTLTFGTHTQSRLNRMDEGMAAGNGTGLFAPRKGVNEYLVWASIPFAGHSTGFRLARILRSGTEWDASTYRYARAALPVNSSGTVCHLIIMDVVRLARGEYVEFSVYQNTGAALNVLDYTNNLIAGIAHLGRT